MEVVAVVLVVLIAVRRGAALETDSPGAEEKDAPLEDASHLLAGEEEMGKGGEGRRRVPLSVRFS